MPELRHYQQDALDFLSERDSYTIAGDGGAGLFLDMGLGKTCITLNALTDDRLPAVVVAPKRVAENVWGPERDKWRPDLSIAVSAGTPAQRARALDQRADITVIGRDNLKDVAAFQGKHGYYDTMVLDELSGFKTRGTGRWRHAKGTLPSLGRTWGLTGTPSPNGLMDLWAQVYLLDGGKRLGTTLTGFRNRYFVPGRQLANGVITEWLLRPEADAAIHAKLEDLCLSMSSEGLVELPETTYNVVKVPMDPKTKAIYKAMKDTLVADLELMGGEIHTASSAAVLSSKLSQISAGFIYDDMLPGDLLGVKRSYDVLHQDKIRATRETVEGTGSPVLVFYRFQAELDLLKAEFGSQLHTADEPNLQARWNKGDFPVLAAHPASAGHGLNLQTGPGHTIVWTSLPWSLEEWQQANKRLSRPGQKHPVMIHILQTPGTVDTAIRSRLRDKTSVQDALLSHLENPL